MGHASVKNKFSSPCVRFSGTYLEESENLDQQTYIYTK
jgi:hypothetical protein